MGILPDPPFNFRQNCDHQPKSGDSCLKSPGMAVRDSDGFGRGSDSDGFGRIPSSPAGDLFAVLQSVWVFCSYRMGSGFGRIR